MINVLLRIELLLAHILSASESHNALKKTSDQDIWLDAVEMKQLLHIGDMTLFRRRNDGTLKSKKIGKKWYYAKPSLV